ncbi:ATP-binding protein [Beggiatoa leptomitoformis]|uniref:histidine kinase n=1 Tax=Beggiatoa leptomitoformis TaxID=288004 RepID=A0A2N9YDY3_9GAMM|nr:ATP-binding protein [Beggiatoa leptomitoformis]ALG68928.1 sensor histidine kinase [Beggiatoa leptomitoformis]AUI68690.1 sensor histidine kinase [Beggiatoa leptomitoformis]
MKQYSLRKRLLLILGSTLIACWGVIVIWVEQETAHEIEEIQDANLAQTARTLLSLIQHSYKLDVPFLQKNVVIKRSTRNGHHYETNIAFIIYFADGKEFRSASAPKFTPPINDEPIGNNACDKDDEEDHGYRDERIGEQTWRVFDLYDSDSKMFVQTGESYAVRDELIDDILFSVLSPFLFSLPLLGITFWLSVGRSLEPLRQVQMEITQRDFTQLHPIKVQGIPQEIKPLLDALNNLFNRLNHAFENERRFTADAAHELRTPLAGIKTQIEVAQRSRDAVQREQAFQQALLGMDRASHLVTQLLALARMDAQDAQQTAPVDLVALCIDVLGDQIPAAHAKNIDLGLEGGNQSATIEGNTDALYLLLRNLVDNAIRYTPINGIVTIEIKVTAQHIIICVIDNGIGIPPEQYERVFERFTRGNHADIKGSGLGLSIVKRIAELHHATLSLSTADNHQGLKVCVSFQTVPNQQG